ncbi:MAG: hypothetical protein JO054_10185 [Actinobacteria bacterium]|nr:hypothetical protein [Actinomycetota bacterium]
MSDALFVGVILLFFVLAVAFVRVCEQLIGPDEEAVPTGGADVPLEEAA